MAAIQIYLVVSLLKIDQVLTNLHLCLDKTLFMVVVNHPMVKIPTSLSVQEEIHTLLVTLVYPVITNQVLWVLA